MKGAAASSSGAQEWRFDSPDALAESLAERIAVALAAGVRQREAASLVVSGGRTPLLLFERLKAEPVAWSSVWITLADERWVSRDAPDSNERLVRGALLAGPARASRFVGMVNDAPSPESGLPACTAALPAVPRPFDVVVLGMGDDGHTASLFPGAPELAAALDPRSQALCTPMHPQTASHPRMSLTLGALLQSRQIFLHLVGDAKWRVYERARAAGLVEDLPVRAILRQSDVPVDVYWSP